MPSDRRINIRYVNQTPRRKPPKELAWAMDNNTADDSDASVPPEVDKRVNDLVKQIPFRGTSRIAYALKSEVLEDLVYMNSTSPTDSRDPRDIGPMKRPLQIMVITDGEVRFNNFSPF